VKRALALKSGDAIGLGDLSPQVLAGASAPAAPSAPGETAAITLEEAERRAILVALRVANGSKVRAADILGIPRTSLYHRLKHHKIDVADVLELE
jgi:transcriptional regulator of acetoin/glycerol metabolism